MNENLEQSVQSLIDIVNEIVELDEAALSDEVVSGIIESFNNNLTPEMIDQSINQIINNFEIMNSTKEGAKEATEALKEVLRRSVYGDRQFSAQKKRLVDMIMDSLFVIFDKAIEKYHNYNIILPMTVAKGAKEPMYAHESDAAADLYAMEDQTISAHTYGNMIHTGIKIQLPEGWLAMILPRSSTGTKTPLRLSNSVGLIDSGYRGELCVLYDNTSDNDYEIKTEDKIAQLLVMPSYRFKANVVDMLEDSDRGEGGFGSTGK